MDRHFKILIKYGVFTVNPNVIPCYNDIFEESLKSAQDDLILNQYFEYPLKEYH
jgi:hypothetical protein